VARNERLRGYVELLEEHYDSRIERAVTESDLTARLEDLLGDRGWDDDEDERG
jgi:hypothetical protein